jgi:ankyrin repeat protein
MASTRFCVGFSSACKQAREGGGLPAWEGGTTLNGRTLPRRCWLPPEIVRFIDALVRRLEHEDALLLINGGALASTLCHAAGAGGCADVRFLLARGADVETTTVYLHHDGTQFSWPALIWAAWFGRHAAAVALLDAGAAELDSALYSASTQGHTDVVALLLDRGADLHFQDGEPLMAAARNGHLSTVALLLDRGADVHTQEDRPLLKSAQCGRLETVRLLLDRGADKPLRSAASKGYLEVVRLLLDRGADVHAGNERALQKARRKGHTAVEALLIERGAREPEN